MLTCPSSICPPDGLHEAVSASLLAVTWPEMVDYASQHAPAAILIAAAFGILVGWLAKRRAVVDEAAEAELPVTAGFEELRWRHEKLVLIERQQVEKQARLDAFVEASARLEGDGPRGIALRMFLLGERVREARQKVGSDLSRMIAVRDRLDAFVAPIERGHEAIGACRGMAEAQANRLEEAREALRGISEKTISLEEAILSGKVDGPDRAALRKELVGLKGQMVGLPQGWATSCDETDRRIRELLATVNEPGLAPVREILLVDGALTASLAGVPGIDLTSAAAGVIRALDALAAPATAEPMETASESTDEGPAAEADAGTGDLKKLLAGMPASWVSPVASTDSPIDFGFPDASEPDSGFRDPSEFAILKPKPAKGFHDLTGGESSGPVSLFNLGHGAGNGAGNGNGHGATISLSPLPLVEMEPDVLSTAPETTLEDGERSLILFCSNDVELWGKTVYRGARCRARAISEFPEWAHWIAIRRLDTGERVFAPLRSPSLRSGQSSDPFGFNGSNELFYGARHLGLFSESCPNEVETRFTYGGWGFGHRAHEIAPEVEQLQAAGWEGREIPADTVFEIVIHEELPALSSRDRLIEGEVRGKR